MLHSSFTILNKSSIRLRTWMKPLFFLTAMLSPITTSWLATLHLSKELLQYTFHNLNINFIVPTLRQDKDYSLLRDDKSFVSNQRLVNDQPTVHKLLALLIWLTFCGITSTLLPLDYISL